MFKLWNVWTIHFDDGVQIVQSYLKSSNKSTDFNDSTFVSWRCISTWYRPEIYNSYFSFLCRCNFRRDVISKQIDFTSLCRFWEWSAQYLCPMLFKICLSLVSNILHASKWRFDLAFQFSLFDVLFLPSIDLSFVTHCDQFRDCDPFVELFYVDELSEKLNVRNLDLKKLLRLVVGPRCEGTVKTGETELEYGRHRYTCAVSMYPFLWHFYKGEFQLGWKRWAWRKYWIFLVQALQWC